MDHISKGKKGERVAEKYLKVQGYTVVERNFRYKRGEIDLIVSKGGVLVFVEVKYRSSVAYGYPEEAVTAKKAALIIKTAEAFLSGKQQAQSIRFDIVSVLEQQNRFDIQHFEDAFY